MRKKKYSFSRTLLSLLVGVPTLFNLAGKIVSLIGLEARLASKNIVSILFLTILIALMSITTWLCLLLMLFFFLISLGWGNISALSLILLINVVGIFILIFLCHRCKKKLLFQETRRRIKHAHQFYEGL